MSAEERAYTEYRFFVSTARFESHVIAVEIVIRPDIAARGRVVCTVGVDLGRSGRVKTQARAMHPGAAIDRAADRAAWLIGRRTGPDFSTKSPAFIS